MGRVITRNFGGCSGAVPSACHSETGCVSTAVQQFVARVDSTPHPLLRDRSGPVLVWRSDQPNLVHNLLVVVFRLILDVVTSSLDFESFIEPSLNEKVVFAKV